MDVDRLLVIVQGWGKRAQVKRSDLEDRLEFDPSRDDFLDALLPFGGHPVYLAAPAEMRSKVLTCGWLAYNEKTVVIETEIVSPACTAVLQGAVGTLRDEVCQAFMAETLVDEAYHVLLAVKVGNLTTAGRGLAIAQPRFNLLAKLRERQSRLATARERFICQMAVATVSELFISEYLAQLSSAESIQPIHRISVASHRKDELAHRKVFSLLAERIVEDFSPNEKDLFAECVALGAVWFADAELGAWKEMLAGIGFVDADRMIEDCASVPPKLSPMNYAAVLDMAGRTGLAERASFAQILHDAALVGEGDPWR